MVTVKFARPWAVPFACRPIRSGVKIAQLLEGIGAKHFAVSFAELWGLSVGEEPVETIAGEVQLRLSRGGYHHRGWTEPRRPAFGEGGAGHDYRWTPDVCRRAESGECREGPVAQNETARVGEGPFHGR